MRRATLETLLAGAFVCPVAYPAEWEDLSDAQSQDHVQAWLEPLGLRMTRAADGGAGGAFFVAPALMGLDEQKRLREQMRQYRDVYGPAIMALDLVRKCDPEAVGLEVGHFVQAGRIEEAINADPALEAALNSLAQVIKRFVMRNSIRDRVEAVLDHLANDGFLVLADRVRVTYQVTGRIDHLWAVLEFIEAHEDIKPDAAESAPDEPEQEDLRMERAAE